MRREDVELLLINAHECSVPACASRLVDIARRVPAAPTTISAFVAGLTEGSPAYEIARAERRHALDDARRIAEVAAGRRMTVAELLEREEIEDDVRKLRFTWWAR